MNRSRTPALGPALAGVLGALVARGVSPIGVPAALPLAAVVVGFGWAWRRQAGLLPAWAALGALLTWAQPQFRADCLDSLDLSRPVTLSGSANSGWSPSETGWRSELAVQSVRQGAEIARCRLVVTLTTGVEPAPFTPAAGVRAKGHIKSTQPARNGTERHPPVVSRHRRYRMHLKSLRFLSRDSPEGGLGWAVGRVARWRDWVAESFEGVADRPGVRAARALLLGDKGALEDGFKRSLRRFGLSHLFAVSGLHVALVCLFVHSLLRGLRHRPRLMLTALAVLGYLLLIGSRPSIVRAASMLLLAYAALIVERPPHSRQALCVAAACLLVTDPGLVSRLTYQLTVSATAGILWLAPAFEARWTLMPFWLRRPLAATLAAQLASLPWTASVFGLTHPLAPLMNLFAIPWMGLFGGTAFLACCVMKIAPASRPFAAAALDLGIAPVAWLDALPPSPWLTLPVALGFFEASAVAVSLSAVFLARVAALRVIGAVVAAVLLRGPSLPPVAEMIVLDVGQGDAIVLHDGERAVLVDGGGWRRGDIGAAVLLPALARVGLRRLDAVVVTHSDTDHCRGVLDLSFYIPIDRVWIASQASGERLAPCVEKVVTRPGMVWRRLWSGEATGVGRWELETLHPAAGARDRGNDSSLVVRAAAGGRSVLLTGDVEARAERQILSRHGPSALASTVLKVAHHGSKTSTTDRFLRAVAPRVAVASAGRANRYGHPAGEILARCRRRRIKVVRTDRDGMIRLPLEPYGNRKTQ